MMNLFTKKESEIEKIWSIDVTKQMIDLCKSLLIRCKNTQNKKNLTLMKVRAWSTKVFYEEQDKIKIDERNTEDYKFNRFAASLKKIY